MGFRQLGFVEEGRRREAFWHGQYSTSGKGYILVRR
jgi:hypothetical protein